MRSEALHQMSYLASESNTKFGKVIHTSDASSLQANLESAGFQIVTEGRKVTVYRGDDIIAQGRSHDAQDALLQAVFSALKEGV